MLGSLTSLAVSLVIALLSFLYVRRKLRRIRGERRPEYVARYVPAINQASVNVVNETQPLVDQASVNVVNETQPFSGLDLEVAEHVAEQSQAVNVAPAVVTEQPEAVNLSRRQIVQAEHEHEVQHYTQEDLMPRAAPPGSNFSVVWGHRCVNL